MIVDDVTKLSLLETRKPDHALPRPFYTDPEIFDLDLRTIWYKDWLFAIPSCEIPQTGNFVTMQVGEYPVVIVRGADGQIRAFHNACRHRGSRVCTALKGEAPKLVCPYHQWTYELDGRLLYARDMGPDFKPADHGLKPVACQDAAGMVFVCLSDDPPAIEGFLEKARRYLTPHRLKRCEGRLREHDHREGKLEARHREQPRVLPLRRCSSRALPDLSRPARLHLHGRKRRHRAGSDRALGEVRGGGAAVEVRHRPGAPVALRPHPAARPGGELHHGRQGGGADEAAVGIALRRRRVAPLLPLSEHLEPLPRPTTRSFSACCPSARPRPR